MTEAKLPAAKVPELVVIEPAAPRRVRRPLDLVGFVVAALGALLSLLIARFAVNTAYGIGKDLTGVAPLVPSFLLSLFSFLLGLGALALPVAVGVDAVLRNRVRDLADGVVAAVAAGLIALLVHVWLSDVAPPQMLAGLVRGTSGGLTTQTTQPFVAALIALFTVAGVGGREGLQRVTWGVLGAGLFSAIVTGVTSPASALLTVCIGRGVGLAARYALGIKSSRPDGWHVADTLGDHGFEVVRLDSTGEVSDRGVRRYLGLTIDGRRLDIHLFDRDQQGVGAVYRLWRRVRLRETVLRRESVSMRQSIERHVLLAYAAQQAGVATPPLLLAAEVGPEATVLVYEEWDGVPLSEAPPGFVSDRHLASAWAQLGRLREHAIAHRNLAPSSIAGEPNGGVWLRPMGLGEVAASDLELRLDVAELLCSLAAVAGPDRAVQSCRAALGEDELMAAVPLLQPIVLSSETRAAVRRNPTVLAGLRSQTLKDSATTTVEPVRIERIRPRTLLTVVAGAVGAYVLLSQLGQVNVSGLLANAHWGWVGVALGGSALTYLAAALIVQGFSPVPLRFERTVLTQLAASFAALVTPPAVGGVAVNVRFVQRSGATPGLAVASIGVAQAVAFAIHLLLLAIAGYLTGNQTGADLLPARRVLIALGVALVMSALALLLPVARRLVVRRVRPFITEVIPRLLDVVQQPKRIALGVSGNLMLNLGYVVALDGAIRAFGGVVPFWSVAVVYLAGSAIGNAAPTPGGLGAVEAALAGGLTAAGLPGDVAVSAVLLYRLTTFWLPIPPGYLAFGWLQRRQAL